MNLLTIALWVASIYTHSFQNWNGTPIPMSNFTGKKILLVNVATDGPLQGQCSELSQLAAQFPDSLVIIAFPSNDFGNEINNDAQIGAYFQSLLRANFFLTAKTHVKLNGLHPIYGWLTKKSENGVADSEVKTDFQKYLIDEQGAVVGVFSGRISPLDSSVVVAIQRNYDF